MLPLLAALAPILLPSVQRAATAISPTAGKVAQAAVDAVSAVVGFPVATTDDAARAVAAIQADPALALKLAQQQDETVCRLIEADNADRASARAREVAMAEHGDRTTRHLAVGIMAGFLVSILVLIVGAMAGLSALKDPTLAALIGSIFGQLATQASSVVSYHFGSSAGSKAKTADLTNLARR